MTLLLRVLAGTAVYALIVVLAAPFPAAAGMMLTFPTLNGIAFVFADRTQVRGMTRSMLWMPVLNGALCATYTLTFLALGRTLPPGPLAWTLTVAVTALFFLAAFRPFVLGGVADDRQIYFALAATVVGLSLVLSAQTLMPQFGVALPAPRATVDTAMSWPAAAEALSRNGIKIALFAGCLTVFLVASRALPLSDGVRGVLAGLPFVPFAGLLSVAEDAALDLDVRLAILRAMAVSVWFGPVVAIWFIYGFPRGLRLLPQASALAWPFLIGSWVVCGSAIAGAAFLLR